MKDIDSYLKSGKEKELLEYIAKRKEELKAEQEAKAKAAEEKRKKEAETASAKSKALKAVHNYFAVVLDKALTPTDKEVIDKYIGYLLEALQYHYNKPTKIKNTPKSDIKLTVSDLRNIYDLISRF